MASPNSHNFLIEFDVCVNSFCIIVENLSTSLKS